MSIFSDYVESYSDLKNAYLESGDPDYGKYVDNYADLLKDYNATGVPDYAAYVDKYPTLATAYANSARPDYVAYIDNDPKILKAYKESNTEKNKAEWGKNYWEKNESWKVVPQTYPFSKEEFGKAYWKDYGPRDKHELPLAFPQTKEQWGENHWKTKGSSSTEARTLPTYPPELTAEEWGAKHWETYGKYEDRILNGAKVGLNDDGSVYVANTDLIGAQARPAYDKLVNTLNNASPGNYTRLLSNVEGTLNQVQLNDFINNSGVDIIESSYTKKITPWDGVTLGAQPPTGGFDPRFYQKNTTSGANALKEWREAQTSASFAGAALPNLDVTGRYTRNSYLHWHYTTQGKAAGERGNAAQSPTITEEYSEYLTDADYQAYRDQVLGLADRFDNIKDWAEAQDPQVLNEWYKSLPSDQKNEYNAGTLSVPTLDYIPDRLRDKVNMTKGTTILEGRLSTVLGEKEKQQQQLFGALTQDSLKQAAVQLQKAKLQEQQYDFYKGLPGLNEVMTINESLANSLLGDTGIGGIFGWMGDTEKTQKSLEKSLLGATGVPSRSNAVYNWQKWFDEELVKRYESGLTVEDPLDASVTYDIDVEFARDYIDRYLKPRFDNSKSMSEFVSYMDVKQNEQNIFQTQSAFDSLRDIADIRSKAYLDNIKSTAPLNFSADFYWNPEGNFDETDPKYQTYQRQKSELAADWETAKTKGDVEKVPGTDRTWNQWAYYYGLDPKDKQQFAKLHYQVKGAAAGFDPAKDLITLKDADEYIQGKILPEITDEKLKIGDITFLNFVTPEEFADKLLEGISPEAQKEEWEKLLQTLGLSEKEMGIAEVKQYIIEAFRTGAAKDIRESIKYLNEKKLTPTQERLGVEYIERPADAAPTDSPNTTALYKIFKNAGYQGNEDEFYDTFMTDIDRNEMELATQASKGLKASSLFSGLSSKDPFESLVSIQSLFDEDDKTTTSTKDTSAPSYFKLFGDDKEDEDYKSKSGQKILGEFTSLFKGFT